jgi:hypothetical protein
MFVTFWYDQTQTSAPNLYELDGPLMDKMSPDKQTTVSAVSLKNYIYE